MHPQFSTCELCNDYKSNASGVFRVLPPVFRDFGAVHQFFGPVVTVKCFEDDSLVMDALSLRGYDETQGGPVRKVLVVDGGASLRRALLGGNLGAMAERNGWAGLVIDGCVRDVRVLSELRLGIRALGSQPMPTVKRNAGQRDVAVHVQDVWVRPGDWLYADADGIVISANRLA
jgi:regulator of ribonuclease activity A